MKKFFFAILVSFTVSIAVSQRYENVGYSGPNGLPNPMWGWAPNPSNGLVHSWRVEGSMDSNSWTLFHVQTNPFPDSAIGGVAMGAQVSFNYIRAEIIEFPPAAPIGLQIEILP